MDDITQVIESESAQQDIGQLLREAREAKQLTLAAVANQLRLSQQIVEQIEANAYDKLPALTYVRGYLRNYAKLVDVVSDDLLVMAEAHTNESSDKHIQRLSVIDHVQHKSRSRRRISWLWLFAIIILSALIGLAVSYVSHPLPVSDPSEAAPSQVVVNKATGVELPLPQVTNQAIVLPMIEERE